MKNKQLKTKNMKKLIFSLLALTLVATACKKQEIVEAPKSTQTLIQGMWEYEKHVTTHSVSGSPVVITAPMVGSSYDVTATKFILYVSGVPGNAETPYTLVGNSVWFNGSSEEDYEITVLTSNQMVLKHYDETNDAYLERFYKR